ncbi:MAG: TIGR02147 family protein [Bdellovibrionaceae bacterium]|nr:TIGR02147 family protein [Pseudobdellovibrionaceae bacterium]
MSIFEFTDYKAFLKGWIAGRPKNGRGESTRMAHALGVSSTMVSQVLSGDRHLNLELADALADHLGLNEKEAEYMFLLVDYERAGTARLKARLRRRIEQAKKEAAVLANRIQKDKELSPEVMAVFYSSWLHSGIRNLSAVPGFNDVDTIAQRLTVPKAVVAQIVDFLLQHGLCVIENGKLTYGPSWTHIPATSPLIAKHHQNWRLRGFAKMDSRSDDDLFFTSPISLSVEAATEIRAMLPTMIERVQKIVRPSPSETIRCLNIDWFEY